MKYVMIYETDPANMSKARELFPPHKARLDEFHGRGTLLMVGAFENPNDGALGIFTTREAAEEFAKGDPFVTGGVVRSWKVLGWNEIYA